MPDLKELYNQFSQRAFTGMNAATNAFSSVDNVMAAGGGVLGGLGEAAKSIGGWALSPVQAAMPEGVKLPLTERAIQPGLKDVVTGEEISPMNQRAGMLANFATLGMREMFWNNFAKSGTYDTALWETAKQVLPAHEATSLVTGESQANPGQMMTPEEWGKNLTIGALKAIPLVKGVKAANSYLTRGVGEVAPAPVRSIAELESGKAALKAANDVNPLGAPKLKNVNELRDNYNNLPKDALPEVKAKALDELYNGISEHLVENGLTPDTTRKILATIPPEDLQANFVHNLLDANKTGHAKSMTELAVRTLQQAPGAIDQVVDIMKENAQTPEQMATLLPYVWDAMTRQSSASGSTLKAYSELTHLTMTRLMRSNPEVYEQVKGMMDAMKLENKPVNFYDRVKNIYTNAEQFWRGVVTSSPVTAARNTTVGGLVTAADLFDSAMAGTEKYLISKAGQVADSLGANTKLPNLTLNEAYWPLINKALTLYETTMGGAKSPKEWLNYMADSRKEAAAYSPIDNLFQEIQQTWPAELKRTFSGPVNDLAVANVMADGLKNAVPNIKKAFGEIETVRDASRFSSSLMSTLSQMSEMYWRKYFFTSRLRENARNFGFESAEALIERAKNDGEFTNVYTGPKYDAASFADLLKSDTLSNAIKEQLSDRLANYEAQSGSKLRASVKEMAAGQHDKLVSKIHENLAEVKALLDEGKSWREASEALSPEAARAIGGKANHPSAAIVDASDYALKQTFAFTPQGGLGGAILKTYQAFPFLHTLGTPFPRFMMNAASWIFDRTPDELTAIANPKFARMLLEGAKDPSIVADPKYIRAFEQAHTGAGLWAAAHYIHQNPDLAGPKYYHIKTGHNENGDPEFTDIRSYRPISDYMFIEHMMKAAANGQDPNLTAAEFTDALTGLRRLNEVAIFALPDIIRQIDATNPGAFVNSLKPFVGQWLGGFTTPFRTINDVRGALGDKSAVVNKDISGNEVVGPTMNNIPGVRDLLPNRIDPFTGEVSGQEHPGIRLAGPAIRSQTLLEQHIQMLGVPMNDLMGNYADPEADRLVRAKMGALLGSKGEDGLSLANRIGMNIEQMMANQPIEMRRTIIRELYKGLRETAQQQAEAENPYAFIEYHIRQQPEAVRPMIRERLKQLEAEKVKRMLVK